MTSQFAENVHDNGSLKVYESRLQTFYKKSEVAMAHLKN